MGIGRVNGLAFSSNGLWWWPHLFIGGGGGGGIGRTGGNSMTGRFSILNIFIFSGRRGDGVEIFADARDRWSF